jgi:energy-converting hydrogenase B subunit D
MGREADERENGAVSGLFDLVMLLLLIATALAVAQAKDLVAAAILFSGYSLTLCLLWQHRGAPDVAMTEAAVGAGVTTILFLVVIARTTRREK